MKKILILITFISIKSFSQNNFYDYIITFNNDTIFGKIHNYKLIDLNHKKHKISTRKIKEIKKNDCIYRLITVNKKDFLSTSNDSLVPMNHLFRKLIYINKNETLYARKLDESLRQDYAITSGGDTIFGQIIHAKANDYKLIKRNGKKIQLNSNQYNQFRKDGFNYYYKQKRKYSYYDKNSGFLKLIYDGKIRLYDYSIITSNYSSFNLSNSWSIETRYYIERNGEIFLTNAERLYSIIKKIMPENEELLKKIKRMEFSYHDIYLITKYFDENTVI